MTITSIKTSAFRWCIETLLNKLIARIIALYGLIVFLAPCLFAQNSGDSTRRFYDDLLNNFVGKWDVDATVHGQKFTLYREAEWVMDHQYLRIHETSHQVIPWLNIPFERTIFIGYNHLSKRYVVYELTVHGASGLLQPEGFSYGERSGNELKVVIKKGSEPFIIQRFTWEPESKLWRFQGRLVFDGNEQDPHVDQTAVLAKTSLK
jgi:hypothetical protein